MNRQDIANALRDMGLKNGDTVMLHSSMLSIGNVDGGADAVVDAFLDTVGPQGTLMVPVFGPLGILTEIIRKRPEAVISPCSKGTVAAIGANAKALCEGHGAGKSVHGDYSPYTKLAELDGIICLLGVDQDRNTTLHSLEALLELPYLSDTTGVYTTPEGVTEEKTWKYYPGPHRDFIGFERFLRAENAITVHRLGNAQVRLFKAKDLFAIGLRLGRQNPAFALCDNPACEACVKQRAAISRDRFQQEAFRIAASARLAGKYIPEIIDNLKAAGVDAVELDYLQGKACARMSAERLTAAVQELAVAGIAVSALRLQHIPEATEPLLKLAVAAGIDRVIMPLYPSCADAVALAQQNGIRLVFANHGQTSLLAARDFAALNMTPTRSFCFSATAFVKAGEMPFLQSYRIGRFIKTIEQLDIADMTWTEEPTRLACGNAEIKELISILRCHNFSGWFSLGGGARFPGTLKDAADDLFKLIDTM
ncbi:MAG: AAC(3) family N-acetyltransferase [Lentisphaerae bacterium]|nr:AAC(3) family N-acetyltransferase [Lentisphaerota bacterium]